MNSLPSIPAKRYFTISEVGSLCGVKPHVLRYWEQEFSQLRPTKRRGNRRYYQLHEVQLIRKIRELLYEQGFTIVGARNKLQELADGAVDEGFNASTLQSEIPSPKKPERDYFSKISGQEDGSGLTGRSAEKSGELGFGISRPLLHHVREELLDIRDLLEPLVS